MSSCFYNYKNFIGSIEYSENDNVYYGSIQNIKDCVNYEVCEPIQMAYGKNKYKSKAEIKCSKFKDKSLMVELPCKAGGMVYSFNGIFNTINFDDRLRNKKIVPCAVVNIRVDKSGKVKLYLRPYFNTIFREKYHIFVTSKALGKTVFLTKEEAEKKLEGMM